MKYDNEQEFIKLANDLEADNSNRYSSVIHRLRNNWYHDFKNPDEAPTPKLQMIQDFEALGRKDIVRRVKNGDFDQ